MTTRALGSIGQSSAVLVDLVGETELDSRYVLLSDTTHYDSRYYTETESDARYSQIGHNHDDRYFTETESDARYSQLGHVHAAADVTSGTFSDARISQSSVTQHQAAFSIGWAQLTSVPSTFTPSAHALNDVTIHTGLLAYSQLPSGSGTWNPGSEGNQVTFAAQWFLGGDTFASTLRFWITTAASVTREFRFATAGVPVWIWSVAGTESGANAGADMTLTARADTTGGNLGTALAFNRATRAMTILGPVTASSGTLALTGAMTVSSNLSTSGLLGVGGATVAGRAIYVSNSLAVASSQALYFGPTFSFVGAQTMIGIYTLPTVAASVTGGSLFHFRADNMVLTAGGVVSTQYGLFINALSGATNNYGVFVNGANASYFGGGFGMADGMVAYFGGLAAHPSITHSASGFDFRMHASVGTGFRWLGTGGGVLMTLPNDGSLILNDGPRFEQRNSGVNHGLSFAPSVNTSYLIQPQSTSTGGMQIIAFKEFGVGNAAAFNFTGYWATENGGKARTGSASIAPIQINAFRHDGADGLIDSSANSKIMAVGTKVGGSNQTLFMWDADAVFHTLASSAGVVAGGVQLCNLAAAAVNNGSAVYFSANRTTGGETVFASVAGRITDITNATPAGEILLQTMFGGVMLLRATVQSNGAIRLQNIAAHPATPVGGAVIYSFNGQLYGKNTSGLATQLT